jgi:ferrous iron transport protein A
LEPVSEPQLHPVAPEAELSLKRLGEGARGFRGVVVQVGGGLGDDDLERRLLEIGFVEGARVEILHTGPVGGDPLAVRIDDMRVALRRREADAILVRPSEAGADW